MTPTILVITGERDWTRRAIHLAAAMAQEAKATILLAHMAPITHPADTARAIDAWRRRTGQPLAETETPCVG